MLSGADDISVAMLIMLSTRSVGANLARRFNAGKTITAVLVRVVQIESGFHASLRDVAFLCELFPALKDRA